MKQLIAYTAIALLALASPAFAALSRGDVIIRHTNVVDVEHATTVPDQAVVVRGDNIVAVGPDADIARTWQAGQTVDGKGRYVMPGLWDMHVHFGGGTDLIPENQAVLPLYLANGITSVRDCAGDIADAVLSWRPEIRDGKLLGPQLFSSGAKLEGINPIWTGTLEVGTREQVDAALARLKSQHADFVKLTDSTFKPELFLYAVSRAKALGFKTSAHIPLGITVEQAVDAGLTSIEHISYAIKLGARDEAGIVADYRAGKINAATARERFARDFDPSVAREKYRWLASRGVFVTPTLYEMGVFDAAAHQHDPELKYIGPGLRETWVWRVERAQRETPQQRAAEKQQFALLQRILVMLQDAGVRILAGTDAGFLNSYIYPGFALHDELETYQAAGLTPQQVLVAATENGPAFFGLQDRYGSVAQGKAADLLLLASNPLKDVRATRDPVALVLRGHVYSDAALQQMLSEAARKVAQWNQDAQHESADISLWKVEGSAAAIGKGERYARDAREAQAAPQDKP